MPAGFWYTNQHEIADSKFYRDDISGAVMGVDGLLPASGRSAFHVLVKGFERFDSAVDISDLFEARLLYIRGYVGTFFVGNNSMQRMRWFSACHGLEGRS